MEAAAPTVVIQGPLLKEGLRTLVLHARYVVVYSNGRFGYWESKEASVNRPPRGDGIVVAAEEWWPKKRKGGVAMMTHHLFTHHGQTLSHADDVQYDGRTFSMRAHLTGSHGIETIHLVAPTRAERLDWLSAVNATIGNEESAGTTASDEHVPASDAAAAPSPAAAAASLAEKAVLDELPRVWSLWADCTPLTMVEVAAASARYAELVRRAPTCWSVLQDRGNFNMRIGEHRRAEADFSSALELHATRAELFNDRAVCRIEQGAHAEALPDLEAALRLRPSFAPALSNLGNVHRELGAFEKAKQAYNGALILAPDNAHTWNNRGCLQEQMGNLVAAELDVRRALELGGCEKAGSNLARICQALAEQGGMELRPLQPCWHKAPPARNQCALVTFTFADGPIGMFLVNAGELVPAGAGSAGGASSTTAGRTNAGTTTGAWAHAADGEVVVHTVYEGSQAHAAGAPVGSVVDAINGRAIGRMTHEKCSGLLGQATRPLALRLRCPPGWRAPGVDDALDDAASGSGLRCDGDGDGAQPQTGTHGSRDHGDEPAPAPPPGGVNECPELD